MKATFFVFLLSVVLFSTVALADVPGQISYQGTLTDAGGVALDTTVSMTFSLWADSTGPFFKIWEETQPAVEVQVGLFNVRLGSVNPLTEVLFPGAPRWLQVQVGSDPALSPRQRLVSVLYAFRAAESDTAEYARSAPPASDGDWTVSGNNLYAAVPGSVGIGTTGPEARLDVHGDINADSLYRVRGDVVLSVAGQENVLLGVGAGILNTGSYGVFIGDDAGAINQGDNNVFIGRNAGGSNTSGSGNAFIGFHTGGANTTGSWNTCLGCVAGLSTTIGSGNTFLGYAAGSVNTEGYRNTFVGGLAGASNETGDNNTCVGEQAGHGNTTGHDNTYLGANSGSSNTTGTFNTFVGEAAGVNNTTGNYNTILGVNAGHTNTIGQGNVFIGYNAGYWETGSDKLYIANGPDTSDVLIYGDFSDGHVGIGTLAPDHPLHVVNPSGDSFSKAVYGLSSSTGTGSQCTGVYGQTQTSALANAGAGVWGYASNSTGGANGVRGDAAGQSGVGVFGWASHTSGTNYGVRALTSSPDGYGVYGENSSGPYGYLGGSDFGVCGYHDSGGYAVYGSQASGTWGMIGGNTTGAYGYSPTDYGVYGEADSLAGVLGICDYGYGVWGAYRWGPHGSVGDSSYGVSGYYDVYNNSYGRLGGESYGGYMYRRGTDGRALYAYMNDTDSSPGYGACIRAILDCDTSGTSYMVSKSGIDASSPIGYVTDKDYLFAVSGEQMASTPRRAGGILGIYDNSRWGCLAYTASSGSQYGAYFTSYTSGTGKSGIGFGSSGELLGGWVRGDLYGLYTSGDVCASYTDGNAYSNGYQAILHDVGGSDRVVTFSPTSMDVDVYAHGVGRLVDGRAEIVFDERFTGLISQEVPVTVSVTPVGVPAGLVCISGKSAAAFSVQLLEIPGVKGGSKDVTFDWIAIGRRKGFERRPEIPAELAGADFDANMRGFAFNEGDLEGRARAMWHDGSSIRWDTPPEEVLSIEKRDRIEEAERIRDREQADVRRVQADRQRMMASMEKEELERPSSRKGEEFKPETRIPERGDGVERIKGR
jgi:hypothetical protein